MVTFVGRLNTVNYTFLSTEMSAGAVDGISVPGFICYERDTGYFWIVEDDLTLTRYYEPSAASTIAPAAQASTNAYVLVAGSILDTLNTRLANFTIENSGAESIDWKVLAGNTVTLSEAIEAQAEATVAAAAYGTFSVNPAVWRYYGVYVKSSAPDTPGEATVIGVTKA